MNVRVNVVALIIALIVIAAAFSSAAEPKGRLLFFGVAYDEAPGPRRTIAHYDYAPGNFTRLFQAQSTGLFAEVRSATVKGNFATKETITAGLKALPAMVRAEDLVVLYWGTHGGTDATGWSAGLREGGLMRGAEIKAALARLPCPAIAVVSTCGSGGFLRQLPEGVDLPPNVAAFCACGPAGSTDNQLDVSLLEGLSGFADADSNGQIALGELMEYVPRRVRGLLRESRSSEFLPVLGKAAKVPGDLALTKVTGDHVAVAVDGIWRGATILERAPRYLKVRFLGYDSTTTTGAFSIPDREVELEQVDLPDGHPPIEVERSGIWLPAKVVSKLAKGPGFRVHFVGRPASEDENIPPRRITFPFGSN